MYILCYTIKIKKRDHAFLDEDEFHSDWQAFEKLQEAEVVFGRLSKRKDFYTASIAEVIKSTDYEIRSIK